MTTNMDTQVESTPHIPDPEITTQADEAYNLALEELKHDTCVEESITHEEQVQSAVFEDKPRMSIPEVDKPHEDTLEEHQSNQEDIAEDASESDEINEHVTAQTDQRSTRNKLLKPVISLRNVSKTYKEQPDKPALQDVNIDIYPGEFLFLVGHSGSGKSTFIRMLIREVKASSGRVMVAGQDLTTMRDWKVPYLRRNIGCVFQDFKLLPDKTAYENVAFALECIGKSKHVIRTQVPEVLRLVGLEEKMHMMPDQLSGGEQQRVSIARAVVNRPPLLICDEPTGNLDPAISLGIMKLLERINRTGTTVLVATHDRDMVDSMRRRVIALENGHLIRDEQNGGYINESL